MTQSATHRTIEAVWRIESAKLIATLTRLVRDIGLAEDLAQDVLVIALEQWPQTGIPHNPGGWLMGTAKHRAIDRLRRMKLAERKHAELGHELEMREAPAWADLDPAREDGDDLDDDLLRLIFTACHPLLSREARVALALRLLGGLTTGEIARAFLVAEATVAQRIVRAKRTLAAARVPFAVPRGADRAARLSSVLEVIYLIFNEGYMASAGDDWVRPGLCEDALRLGRVLGGLMVGEPEVHGLLALMELQASRMRTRVAPSGEPILLLAQDRGRWDQLLIRRGLAAGRGPQSGGGGRDGVWAGGRTGPGGRAGRRACAPRLPPPAQCARPSAGPARAAGGGPRRIRARGWADAQRPRARSAAAAGTGGRPRLTGWSGDRPGSPLAAVDTRNRLSLLSAPWGPERRESRPDPALSPARG